MTETPTISDHPTVAIGPGRLILVVGPSGAGKDTLIGRAQAACAGDGNMVFPRRIVTREASDFEANDEFSLDAFYRARRDGAFAIDWEAHGHCYALPRAIDDDTRAGRTVVANVSRTVLGALRRAYADVVVISITAPPDILEQRLAARARGSDGRIEQRLRRVVDDAAVAPDITIFNVGDVEDHAGRLIGIIRGD